MVFISIKEADLLHSLSDCHSATIVSLLYVSLAIDMKWSHLFIIAIISLYVSAEFEEDIDTWFQGINAFSRLLCPYSSLSLSCR